MSRINRDVVPLHYGILYRFLAAQVQQASVTRFVYQHLLCCHSQVEQASLTRPLYHYRPYSSVLDRSAVRTLRCSSGAPCRPAK